MVQLWTDEVSGSGSVEFGDSQVWYILFDVTAIGTVARRLELGDPDHILRFGWVALGNIFDPFGTRRDMWREPIWIDFEHAIWTPVPQVVGGGSPLVVNAGEIRWSINPGGSVVIEVHSP